jgi:hypothetical protein
MKIISVGHTNFRVQVESMRVQDLDLPLSFHVDFRPNTLNINLKDMVSMVRVATFIPIQSRKAYHRWKFYYINLILIHLPGKTLLSIRPPIPPYRHQYIHYFSFSTLPHKNEEVCPKPSKKHRGNRRGLTWKPKPQCWQSPMYNLFQK